MHQKKKEKHLKFLSLFCNSLSLGWVGGSAISSAESIFCVITAGSQPPVLWLSGNEGGRPTYCSLQSGCGANPSAYMCWGAQLQRRLGNVNWPTLSRALILLPQRIGESVTGGQLAVATPVVCSSGHQTAVRTLLFTNSTLSPAPRKTTQSLIS